jgi:hypothetical protein
MDTKLTLSLDEAVISKAKRYAATNNISLSRLVEFLLQKVTSPVYKSLEDFPISDWVSEVSEGSATYQTTKKRTRKSAKAAYFSSKR